MPLPEGSLEGGGRRLKELSPSRSQSFREPAAGRLMAEEDGGRL